MLLTRQQISVLKDGEFLNRVTVFGFREALCSVDIYSRRMFEARHYILRKAP
jgi:hypothetical protein